MPPTQVWLFYPGKLKPLKAGTFCHPVGHASEAGHNCHPDIGHASDQDRNLPKRDMPPTRTELSPNLGKEFYHPDLGYTPETEKSSTTQPLDILMENGDSAVWGWDMPDAGQFSWA
ncbi:hypothetical protein TNIN_287131 [Trichonephila inaurata madagascariensis]|uniref:Uncharacterized protein n=1 Tax=Trichonephila inaurata madagascariensis TaxID=2747483 RepID=A0A8X6XP37_9ARAC|nr:hypothetical protein TNIN_287131 [Trichonephila inaurata madagascariensis]